MRKDVTIMAKKKDRQKKIFVLPTGEQYRVTGENGVYWFCEDADGRKTQFRKAAGRGVISEEAAKEPKAAEKAESDAKEGE